MQKRGVMLIGYFIITIGMLMIGGSQLTVFNFQGHPTFVLIGMMLLGLAGGLISIPVLPEMVEVYESDQELSIEYDKKQVEILISGLFVSCSSFGSVVGPIMASNLKFYFSFEVAQDTYAILLMIFMISYFCICGNIEMFGAANRMTAEEEEERAEFIRRQQSTSRAS